MDATKIRRDYCSCQLSEVGQKSDGVAVSLTDTFRRISGKLRKAGVDTGAALSKSDDF